MENPKSTDVNTVALVESESCPMGVQLVDATSTNKMRDPMDLVQLAQQVQQADGYIRANAGNKLTVIAEQIRFLQEQAKKVLEDAKRDHDLHHAACNMVKKPGSMYFMYERETGQKYLSLISPQEWGASCPHKFINGYRMEHDHSFTPVDQLDKRSEEISLVDKILNTQIAITDTPHFRLTKTASRANVKEVSSDNGPSHSATSGDMS